jgi:putative flippase GtrA
MSSLFDYPLRRLRDPGPFGQIMRFSIVGGLGFLVDAGVLKAMIYFGAGPTIGRVISIWVTMTFTWMMHRTLTFAIRKAPSWGEYGHYVLSSLVGALINYAVYWVAVYFHTPLLIALAMGVIVGSVFNFLRYRVLLSDKDAGEIPSP